MSEVNLLDTILARRQLSCNEEHGVSFFNTALPKSSEMMFLIFRRVLRLLASWQAGSRAAPTAEELNSTPCLGQFLDDFHNNRRFLSEEKMSMGIKLHDPFTSATLVCTCTHTTTNSQSLPSRNIDEKSSCFHHAHSQRECPTTWTPLIPLLRTAAKTHHR